MSVNRLVLRLATVCALNNFRQAPYPTLAGDKIYDSKIESVENTAADVAFPICVVYTDYDKDHWRSGGKMHAERTLTITFELLIAQISDAEEGDGFVINFPQTDSELETSLDIFEAQVFAAFQASNPAADCFRGMVSAYENAVSRRGATVESGQRIAARQITIECRVPRDPVQGAVPEYAAAFLTALEADGDYGWRVPSIRAAYTGMAALTDAERVMATQMWSDRVSTILGYERGAPVMIGTPVVWIDSVTGNPL